MILQESISHLRVLKKLEGLDLKSTKRSRIVDGYISSIKFQDTYESDNL